MFRNADINKDSKQTVFAVNLSLYRPLYILNAAYLHLQVLWQNVYARSAEFMLTLTKYLSCVNTILKYQKISQNSRSFLYSKIFKMEYICFKVHIYSFIKKLNFKCPKIRCNPASKIISNNST